jgi:hypothetical protein
MLKRNKNFVKLYKKSKPNKLINYEPRNIIKAIGAN